VKEQKAEKSEKAKKNEKVVEKPDKKPEIEQTSDKAL
jgi:hypothetical protein